VGEHGRDSWKSFHSQRINGAEGSARFCWDRMNPTFESLKPEPLEQEARSARVLRLMTPPLGVCPLTALAFELIIRNSEALSSAGKAIGSR